MRSGAFVLQFVVVKGRLLPLLFGLCAVTAGLGAESVSGIKAGFAERDITPGIGSERPGGYAKAFHTRFHDPCKVRAAVFETGTRRVVVIGVDALFVPRTVVVDARVQIQKRTDIPGAAVMIAATHSHSSGPVGMVQPGQFDTAPEELRRLAYDESSLADAGYLLRVTHEIVQAVSRRSAVTLVNSINPHRLQGQKTASFEICDTLGRAPDYHVLPVGNAGNITADWIGYTEYRTDGRIEALPRMRGFQAAGAAPIVLGHKEDKPETVASAIRIGNPVSWKRAEAARDESHGVIESVTDEEILEAYKLMAATEGVFAEPASCASVAGVAKLAAARRLERGTTTVCTLTGHGLKDPDNAIKVSPAPVYVPANVEKALEIMDLT